MSRRRRPAAAAAATLALCALGAARGGDALDVAVVPPELVAPLGAALKSQWHLAAIGSATQEELRSARAFVPNNAMDYNQTLLLEALAFLPNATLLQIPMTGYETLDLSLVPPRFTVCNVHSAGIAIPEYVIAAVMSWNVQLPRLDADFRRCAWKAAGGDCPPLPPLHRETRGQTLGILGYGTIGQGIAARAAALGMRVVAVTEPTPAEAPPPLAWVGNDTYLPRLMQESDFIVLSCPLLDSTRGIITPELIGMMRPTGVLVNIARGPVVDEQGLFDALAAKRIGGAVLDVWWQWPAGGTQPSRFNFSSLTNVWMTPHSSFNTMEEHEEVVRQSAFNLDALVAGTQLQNVIRGPGAGQLTRGQGIAPPRSTPLSV